MKLKELKEQVDLLIEKHRDYTVTTSIQGLSGSVRELQSVGIGFDWNSGQILLSFGSRLADFDTRKYYKLRDAYLRKVSNLKKIQDGAKVARYKKEEKEFENHWDAERWIYTKFEDDFS